MRKFWLLAALLLGLAGPSAGVAATPTFSEEFTRLDSWDFDQRPAGRWAHDYGYGGTWNWHLNDEKQFYTGPWFNGHKGDFEDGNYRLNKGGTLSIIGRRTAKPEVIGLGAEYTSGLLTTRASFAQRYGYFEIRAYLPSQPGTWPAFWLVSTDKSWPPEIDVFEGVSGKLYHFLHSTEAGRGSEGGESPFPADGVMHTYGVEWTPLTLRYYRDRKLVFERPTPKDMNRPMYMIINLALGGGWPGPIDFGPSGEAVYTIDYVKVWTSLAAAGRPK